MDTDKEISKLKETQKNIGKRIVDEVKAGIDNLRKEMIAKYDKNKDGKVDAKEIADVLASKDFKAIIFIFILPILTAFIGVVQAYIQDGVWEWSSLIWVSTYIIAPVVIAWIRKYFSTENKTLEEKNKTLTKEKETLVRQHEQELAKIERQHAKEIAHWKIMLHLQAEYIRLYVPAEKQPPDEYFNKTAIERFASS